VEVFPSLISGVGPLFIERAVSFKFDL